MRGVRMHAKDQFSFIDHSQEVWGSPRMLRGLNQRGVSVWGGEHERTSGKVSISDPQVVQPRPKQLFGPV